MYKKVRFATKIKKNFDKEFSEEIFLIKCKEVRKKYKVIQFDVDFRRNFQCYVPIFNMKNFVYDLQKKIPQMKFQFCIYSKIYKNIKSEDEVFVESLASLFA
jgi:hypothetical protein